MLRPSFLHRAQKLPKTRWPSFLKPDKSLLINTITCGIFGFTGDYLAQYFEHVTARSKLVKNDSSSASSQLVFEHNLKRSLLFSCAHLSMGPVLHYFYKFLDKKWPTRSTKHIFYKVLSDYSFAGPYLALFFGSYCLLQNNFSSAESEKSNFQNYKKNCYEKIPVYLIIDLFLWVPVQIVNFSYVSSTFRVLGVKFAELFFNFVMSFVYHNEVDLEETVGKFIGN